MRKTRPSMTVGELTGELAGCLPRSRLSFRRLGWF